MAKLSARGRTTLVSMVKELPDDPELEIRDACIIIRLMSDGKVLERRKWNGRYGAYSSGWKVRFSTKNTPEAFQKKLEALGYHKQ